METRKGDAIKKNLKSMRQLRYGIRRMFLRNLMFDIKKKEADIKSDKRARAAAVRAARLAQRAARVNDAIDIDE